MHSRLTFRSRCAALLIYFVILPASAATWNNGTQLGLTSDWNDNPALADDFINPEGTFRFLASYDGVFERQAESSNFNLRPRVTTDYYPDSKFSNLQTTDLFLPGSFNYRRPRNIWTLSFNVSQQSVLSDEATTSQGAPIGTLQGDDTLTQLSLSPSTLWQITEKDELQFGLSYSISDYDLEFTNRSDTTSLAGNFSYRRSLNERHAVGLSGFLTTSDADRQALIPVAVVPPTIPPTFVTIEGEVTNDSTSSYFTADYDFAISEASTLSISYGLQDSETESTTNLESIGQEQSTGQLTFSSTTYDIKYLNEFPRGRYSIGANRSVTLDITNGQPQDRYQISFDGEYKLTEKALGSWRLLAWQQEAVALQSIDENNLPVQFSRQLTYASAEVRMDWNLTRKWYINGRYEYRWRDTDQSLNNVDQDRTATSNQLSIGITYVWKELPRR